MRYQGEYSEIEAIEKEIKDNAICMTRGKIKTYDDLFGIPSPVSIKVYDVVPRKEAKLFQIRFFYDNRDRTATVDIKNQDEQAVRKISPHMPELFSILIPQRQDNLDIGR